MKVSQLIKLLEQTNPNNKVVVLTKKDYEPICIVGENGNLTILSIQCEWQNNYLKRKKEVNSDSIHKNQKFNKRAKEQLISIVEYYFDIVKKSSDFELKEETNFKNEFGFEDEHKAVWRIFSRCFSGFYPLNIAEEYLQLIKIKDIDVATNEIINKIHTKKNG